ncbi:unnamed protein product [Brassica oleracea]
MTEKQKRPLPTTAAEPTARGDSNRRSGCDFSRERKGVEYSNKRSQFRLIIKLYRQNMKGADCNLDIMPPRKKQNKRSNKLNLKKRTLSKSQKLELKKLEEDREKELLSAKKI